jgi:predicted nuclease of predicted toxin-antitoxin system
MKLIVDMNLSPRWVDLLLSEGFDAVHWSSIGAMDAPDTTIMAYAHDNDYVVLTHDLDLVFAASVGGAAIKAHLVKLVKYGHLVKHGVGRGNRYVVARQ